MSWNVSFRGLSKKMLNPVSDNVTDVSPSLDDRVTLAGTIAAVWVYVQAAKKYRPKTCPSESGSLYVSDAVT
jgi:hypothetical protein